MKRLMENEEDVGEKDFVEIVSNNGMEERKIERNMKIFVK
jgi:hypothetical protein